jgi:predicted lipid-binding transport protein (Tim44 family)
MRTTIVAMLVASGIMIFLPALAQQQQTAPNPQMQEEADKGAKTRQSGESGYVGEQEKPGASPHAPGRTDAAPPTTGSATGTSTGAAGSGERPR